MQLFHKTLDKVKENRQEVKVGSSSATDELFLLTDTRWLPQRLDLKNTEMAAAQSFLQALTQSLVWWWLRSTLDILFKLLPLAIWSLPRLVKKV